MRDLAPWNRQQLVAGAVLGAAGLGAVLLGWWGSAGEETISDQTAWLNVATGGLVVALCGAGSLVLFGRRAIGARRRRLLDHLEPVGGGRAAVEDPSAWLWVPGTVRAHRAGCGLVRGKQVEVVDPDDVRRRSLQRCEVCGS